MELKNKGLRSRLKTIHRLAKREAPRASNSRRGQLILSATGRQILKKATSMIDPSKLASPTCIGKSMLLAFKKWKQMAGKGLQGDSASIAPRFIENCKLESSKVDCS